MLQPSNLSVAVISSVAFVKVAGRANFTISVNFKTLLHELEHQGFHRFVLDLTDCPIMDSTFLGVLARISMDLEGQRAGLVGQPITLLNPNAKVADLLDNLGVFSLFGVRNTGVQPPADYQAAAALVGPAPTKEQISRNCLDAHLALMAANPENIPKFKDVAKFLEEDLKRGKSNGTC